MFKSASLVYNPGSGKKLGHVRAENFAARWQAMQPRRPLQLLPSASAEDFSAKALAHYRKGNLLVLMGGDGSFSLGISALFAAAKKAKLDNPVALLPAGSGNSFLRDFGIADFDTAADRLFAALAAKKVRAVDCGRFRFARAGKKYTRFFINIWSIGLVSDINLLAARLRKAYTLATLLKIPGHRRYIYDINADGRAFQQAVNFISVSNSKYTGGAMLMAPMAETADGKLDAIVARLPRRFALLGLFPKIFSGKHIESPHIDHFTFKKLRIGFTGTAPVMIDGEMDYADSVEIDVLPKSWSLLV